MNSSLQQPMPSLAAAAALRAQSSRIFPSGTEKLQLLSGIKPIEKQPEARKPILSKDARVVYLATAAEGMTMQQAIEEANANGLTLIPNKAIYERLNGKEQLWRAEAEFYPCWTGTFIAYGVSNQKLGKTIEHILGNMTYVFPVPKNAQGSKNIALAINHGFTEEGKPLISFKKPAENKFLIEIADESKIKIINNFPTTNGWHLTEKEFGTPTGLPASKENKNARKFHRYSVFVGLLDLGNDYFDVIGYMPHADAFRVPSSRLGVLAYAKQEPQAEEIQK